MKLKKMMAILLSIALIMSNSSMVVLAETAGDDQGDQVNAVTEEESVEEIVVDEIKNITIVAGEITLLKFVPKVSGIYSFTSMSSSDTYGYLYDSEKNELEYDDDDGEGSQFFISHELEAGVTYYWGARYYSGDSAGNFDVKVSCVEAYCDHNSVETVPAEEVDCYNAGYTAGEKCKDCGTWVSGHEFVELYHSDDGDDGLCDYCEKEMPVSRGTCGGYWISSEDGDGSCDGSAKYYKYADGTLEIYGEGSVKNSDGGAFAYSSSIKKVIVREGITKIGYNSFSECSNLTEVLLPESVEDIGSEAFSYCYDLETITILNPACTIYDYSSTIWYKATIVGHKGSTAEAYAQEYGRDFWEYCPHESTTEMSAEEPTCYTAGYTAGEKCNDCGRWASGHEFVELYHSDDGDDGLCDHCEKEMPTRSGTCGGYWIDETDQLDGSAKYYMYADGTLEIYGEGSVESYEEGAFAYSSSIKKVIVREGITKIGSCSFYDCDSLEEVLLPESVASIGYEAFYSCSNLETITILNSACTIYDSSDTIHYKATIVGHKGSTAEAYAQEYGRDFLEYCPHESTTEMSAEEADCYNAGYTAGEKCNDCGRWISGHELVELYHSDDGDDGLCDRCGTEMPVSRGTCGGYWISSEDGEGSYDGSAKYYKYADGTLEIYGEGSVKNSDGGAFAYSSSIKKVIVREGITDIGSEAFYDCDSIEEVLLPESVASIGYGAFYRCDNLETITILNSACTIYDNYDTIYYKATIVGHKGSTAEAYAQEYGREFLEYCPHENTTAMSAVEPTCYTFGYAAGEKCNDCGRWASGHERGDALSHKDENSDSKCDYCGNEMPIDSGTCGGEVIEEDLYDGSARYYKYADGTLEIYGEGEIADAAFDYDDDIKKVIVKEGITAIGYETFEGCDSLEEVLLPESVTSIDSYAFYSCDELRSITLSKNVVNIGNGSITGNAIIRCYKDSVAASYAETKEVPYVLLDGGDEANIISGTAGPNFAWRINKLDETLHIEGTGSLPSFSGTDAPWAAYGPYVTKLYLSSGITGFRAGAFSSLNNLRDVYVPSLEDWLKIDKGNSESYNPMYYADNLYLGGELAVNIKIPEGVKELKDYAFAYIDTIETVTFPHSLESIGESVFYDCDGLKSIAIPPAVEYIDWECFEGCESLEEVRFLLDENNHSEVYGIGGYAFRGCPIEEVVVPASVNYINSNALPTSLMHLTIYNPECEISSNCGVTYNTTIYGFKGSTAEEFATEQGLAFVDVETVHTHKYKTFYTSGYCKRQRCTCGKEINTKHVDKNKDIVCDVCKKTTNDIAVNKTTTIVLENGTSALLSFTPTVDGIYTFNVKGTDDEVSVRLKNEELETLSSRYPDEGETVVFTQELLNQERVYLELTKSKEPVEITVTYTKKHVHGYTSKITKKPTCTLNGVRTYTCECGDSYTRTEDRLGHSYSKTYTVDKKATTSANGSKSKHCTRSGCTAKTSVTAIPKISSVKLSAVNYTYDGKAKKPTVTVKNSKGTTLKNGTDYTVTYASGRTKVGKYKVTVTFKGNYSGSKALYFEIGPKNPSSVKTTLYGHNDVKVSWSKVSGASGYKVYYKKSSASSWSLLKTTTATSYKKANLADGVKYDFKVVAYKNVSGNPCENTGKTSSIYTLKKVAGVKAAKSGTKVKVSWTNIPGETGYEISQSTSKTGTKVVATYATTSGKYKTVSATKGKTYYYKVRAYKTVGKTKIYGPWSSPVKYKR